MKVNWISKVTEFATLHSTTIGGLDYASGKYSLVSLKG
jgi:hypothetical protein